MWQRYIANPIEVSQGATYNPQTAFKQCLKDALIVKASEAFMSQVRNPWNDWFNYVFTYLPTTNWQHAFSPTINFGCNTEDAPVEQHVVDSVGSYGFQLNRVIDVLSVIINHSMVKGLGAEEKEKVRAFKELARAADDAAKGFEGQITETGVEKLITGIRSLQESDPKLYEKLKNQILKTFEALPAR